MDSEDTVANQNNVASNTQVKTIDPSDPSGMELDEEQTLINGQLAKTVKRDQKQMNKLEELKFEKSKKNVPVFL